MGIKPASKEFVERLVEVVERGILTIARISGADSSFIKKTLKSRRDEESLTRRRKYGVAPPLDEEQLAVLQATLEICPEATIEELQRLIADECKVRVSRKSIRHALKKLNPPLVKGD